MLILGEKKVFNTISGYYSSKVPAGEELAETPLEGTAWGTVGEVHRSCFSPGLGQPEPPHPKMSSELLGAVRDSGRAKRCSCLGYVTSAGPLWFPQRAKLSHLWICKSAQRSSLRLCACKKGSRLWSRGYKHNIEYQMAFLMLAGASRHFQRLQPVEELMKFCKQSPSHLAAFFAVFQSRPTAVTWKSLPLFQGFTWSL